MIISPIQTAPVTLGKYTLTQFLDEFLHDINEHDVVVITSKVVSICEGNAIPISQANKDDLVAKEADYYLPKELNTWGVFISIKNSTLIANAGIDESNGDGHFILWPKNLQGTANTIREFLCLKFHLREVGVIISDSHLLPLRWGTVGTALAHSGFLALNSYIGKPDIFGLKLKMTYSNIAENLTAAAVVVMGEGAEQTPLAVISDVPFVQFQDRNPSAEELSKLAISKEEDIFAPLLTSVNWEKGKK